MSQPKSLPGRRAVGAYKARPAGSLKAATTELVEAAGGLGRAAELTGYGTTQVQRWGDPSEENLNTTIPAAAIRRLESDVGRPVVSAFLAAEAGAVLLPVMAMTLPTLGAGAIARVAKEAADVLAAGAASIEDGAVTPREAGTVIREVDEAIAVLVAYRALLVAARDGGGSEGS